MIATPTVQSASRGLSRFESRNADCFVCRRREGKFCLPRKNLEDLVDKLKATFKWVARMFCGKPTLGRRGGGTAGVDTGPGAMAEGFSWAALQRARGARG